MLPDALQFGYGRCTTTTCFCPCYEVVWRHDTRHSSVACFPTSRLVVVLLLSRPRLILRTPCMRCDSPCKTSESLVESDTTTATILTLSLASSILKASCRQVVSLKRYILLCIIIKVFRHKIRTVPYKEVHKDPVKNCWSEKKVWLFSRGFHRLFLEVRRIKKAAVLVLTKCLISDNLLETTQVLVTHLLPHCIFILLIVYTVGSFLSKKSAWLFHLLGFWII